MVDIDLKINTDLHDDVPHFCFLKQNLCIAILEQDMELNYPQKEASPTNEPLKLT